MEIVRSRIKRSLFERSAGFNRSTRYRVVPLERLGLYFETCHDDDQTKRTDDNDAITILRAQLVAVRKYVHRRARRCIY